MPMYMRKTQTFEGGILCEAGSIVEWEPTDEQPNPPEHYVEIDPDTMAPVGTVVEEDGVAHIPSLADKSVEVTQDAKRTEQENTEHHSPTDPGPPFPTPKPSPRTKPVVDK